MSPLVEDTLQDMIPVREFLTVNGTWSDIGGSGLTTFPGKSRSAANGNTTVIIPINVPASAKQFGKKLSQIVIPAIVNTQALTTLPTVSLRQHNIYSYVTGRTQATSLTSIPITSTTFKTTSANPGPWTITVNTPAYENTTGAPNFAPYILVLSIPCTTTTALSLGDAQVLYNLPAY